MSPTKPKTKKPRKTTSRKMTKTAKGASRLPSEGELSEKIEKKAYELYEQRGYSHGQDQSDWYEAEQSVRAELN